MESWELILAIALPLAAIAALVLTGYYILLPKFAVKKIRGGEENLKYPENFEEIAAKVSIKRDLTYPSAFPHNNYDLYTPSDGASKGLVVWIHGGFFIAGDKKGVDNVCTVVAAEGFHVAAINYAPAPEHKYPAAVIQTDEALAHLISSYPEPAGRGVVLAGDSAGGQIAAQYAALTGSRSLQKDMALTPSQERGMLKGAVLVCAPIDVAELRTEHKLIERLLPVFGRIYYGKGKWYKHEKFKSSRLFDYIDASFPPAFITDGNNVSFENQNRKLAALLDEKGVYNETLFFPSSDGKVNHEYLFDLSSRPAPQALERLTDFLKRVCNAD